MKIELRAWLDHAGMTAEKLAAELKTSKSVVSKLETGEQRWNQDWLEEVAFIFKCDVRDLYHPPEKARVNNIVSRVIDEMTVPTKPQ